MEQSEFLFLKNNQISKVRVIIIECDFIKIDFGGKGAALVQLLLDKIIVEFNQLKRVQTWGIFEGVKNSLGLQTLLQSIQLRENVSNLHF